MIRKHNNGKKFQKIKKNFDFEFCKIGLRSKEYRYLAQEYMVTSSWLLDDCFFYDISFCSIKNLCFEYLYKPNGDFRNFF